VTGPIVTQPACEMVGVPPRPQVNSEWWAGLVDSGWWAGLVERHENKTEERHGRERTPEEDKIGAGPAKPEATGHAVSHPN
jgi:hypothetical protein